MKTLFKLIACLMLMISVSSCSDEDETIEIPALEINYVNLDGVWKLKEWNNAPIAEGLYCYIELERKGRTFKIYQKFDSMYARCITGEFSLETDENAVTTISGCYDYGMGEWNNTYIISDLLETGSMVWTVEGDETDVSIYERCDEVPADVIAEAKSYDEE